MSRYIGCETAREQLDAFLDGELSVDDQVVIETHLRWCRTCACRVEDHRLIGGLMRDYSPAHQASADDAQTIAAIPADVLMRIHTERDQSFGVRVREMFSDMRLVWFALGATTALAVCMTGAFLVLHWSSEQRPASLDAMISTLAQPGTEQNPLNPDSGVPSLDYWLQPYVEENRLSMGISIPRTLDDGGMFEELGTGDAVFALSTVVSRDGRIANYQVLSEPGGRTGQRHPDRTDAVLADAVRQSRFAPAQTPGGNKVAVNMVWLIISTTAVNSTTSVNSTTAVKPGRATPVAEVRQPVPVETPEQVPPVPVPPPATPEVGGDRGSALPLPALV